jgi:bifunctional UDP-N-acetylglucosamine pyrophosphorylase/glucosamine-1-phosphate N-acetyltransferase
MLGQPLLEHVLRAVEGLGSPSVTVLVEPGPQGDAIEAAVSRKGVRFLRSSAASTNDVVRELLEEAETVLVLPPDRPLLRAETLRSLIADHEAGGAAATLSAPGIAALSAPKFRSFLENVPVLEVPTLDDAIARLAASGSAVRGFGLRDPQEALAVSSLPDLAGATRVLRDRRLAALLAEGVLVEDPSTTLVSPEVTVEAGAVIRPFTLLEGRSIVRKGASIGPFARVVDSEIGADAQILDHCFLRECVVEAGASVGPFAHLRPESRVGARAKVGNFVELKKTHLGEGSKAPHLSYLGDSTIGPGVNVGAGTITCNYDGTHKHPTRIEAGAFVGSNSTLVAPVVVGEGAYVAAGSTITEDVPARSLALGRARQVLKSGWVRRKKEDKPERG